MLEKGMMILPVDVIKKIDANRGDLSQAEFINFLVEIQLKEAEGENGIASEKLESIKSDIKKILLREEAEKGKYVTREEVETLQQDVKKALLKAEAAEKKYTTKEETQALHQDTKKLLKNFLDFFIGYGLELGKKSPNDELAEITSKLQGLEEDLDSGGEGGEVKIKWK